MKIRPMIGEYEVPGIQRIGALERRQLATFEVPGLAGSFHQDLGRVATRVVIEGTLAGDDARDAFLEAVREKLAAGSLSTSWPTSRLQPRSSRCSSATSTCRKWPVPPTASVTGSCLRSTCHRLLLPPIRRWKTRWAPKRRMHSMSASCRRCSRHPEFGNPVPPLSGAIDGAKAALQSLSGVGPQLAELFGST
jgi:hypothetical protein